MDINVGLYYINATEKIFLKITTGYKIIKHTRI